MHQTVAALQVKDHLMIAAGHYQIRAPVTIEVARRQNRLIGCRVAADAVGLRRGQRPISLLQQDVKARGGCDRQVDPAVAVEIAHRNRPA